MRPVVSYDDITTLEDSTPVQLGPPVPSTNQPPAKKRKMHQKTSQRRPPQQHWDDPGSSAQVMNYQEEAAYPSAPHDSKHAEDVEEEEESRELTYDEIWDDSALIDAWNSANAEYEAYHGKGADWKKDAVKKSPLWYNVPPSTSKTKNGKGSDVASDQEAVLVVEEEEAGEDSAPLNFDTYVPTHDPSLAPSVPPHPPAIPGPDYAQYYLPNPTGPMVNQDEAFSRALSAMYWGGYWTAVYHCQRNLQGQTADANGETEQGDEDDEIDDLVSTQR